MLRMGISSRLHLNHRHHQDCTSVTQELKAGGVVVGEWWWGVGGVAPALSIISDSKVTQSRLLCVAKVTQPHLPAWTPVLPAINLLPVTV